MFRWLRRAKQRRKTKDLNGHARQVLAESEQIVADLDQTIGELNDLDPIELAWLEWFRSLPESHKKLVELCTEKGMRVTPENFDEVLTALKDQSTSP